ncbi:MAG: hypothetical protein NTV94_13835 [Planctomycetota bacterium]|nr:hypothetical protein [Planctomycetota bacterium]
MKPLSESIQKAGDSIGAATLSESNGSGSGAQEAWNRFRDDLHCKSGFRKDNAQELPAATRGLVARGTMTRTHRICAAIDVVN